MINLHRELDEKKLCGRQSAPNFLLRSASPLRENRPVHDQETPEQRAIRLLTVQLKEIGAHICGLNDDQHHEFKAWRDVWSAGQSVSGVHEVLSVSALVDRMAAEYAAARSRLGAESLLS